MAKQGAVNVAENRGWTVQGEAKLVGVQVAPGTFGTECTARTRACKSRSSPPFSDARRRLAPAPRALRFLSERAAL